MRAINPVRDTAETALALAAFALVVALLGFWFVARGHGRDVKRIGDLERRVGALCSHGESSISGVLAAGRFRVTSGPNVTGCAP